MNGVAISQTQEEEPSPGKDFKRLKSGFQTQDLPFDWGRTNDEIHTTIEFCPVVKAIMDSRQFQRLRGLKQLGTCMNTYMNANHSRFEHSLGVAHLAESMVSRIMMRQPNLRITEKDKLCVKIAGLCHDLGHGPFSHVFDDVFPKRLEQHLKLNEDLRKHYDGMPERPEGFTHEEGSCKMIDAMLADMGLEIDMENLDHPLKQIGDGVTNTAMRVYRPCESKYSENGKPPTLDTILTSRDWVFIKEMIIARPLKYYEPKAHESGFVGRTHRQQEFLYDIVSNRHSGLDVDKMDYFARDDRRAFRGSGEVETRLIDEVVVTWGDCPQPQKCFRCRGRRMRRHLMTCYPDKCAEHVSAFFHRRMRLHASVYTHKTTQASTFMIADILALADPFFRLQSDVVEDDPKLQKLPLSRAMVNPNIYGRLRDSVVDLIEFSDDPRLKPAQELIHRMHGRDFYKCVAVKKIDMRSDTHLKLWGITNKRDTSDRENEIENQVLSLKGMHPGGVTLDQGDVIVECRSIHMGAGPSNPVLRMRFIPKRDTCFLTNESIEDLPQALSLSEDEFDAHIPRSNQENSIRAFSRSSSKEKCDVLRHIFHLWENHCEEQLSGDGFATFEEGEQLPVAVEDFPLTQEDVPPAAAPDESPFPVYEKNTPAGTASTRRAPRNLLIQGSYELER